MTEVVSIRFKSKGKIYFFDPAGNNVTKGDFVVVETAKGLEYAECALGNHMVEDASVIPPLRPVIRRATEEDTRKAAQNKKREEEAFAVCKEKIEKHQLEMKLVDVECNFEGSKILFFFISDGRVDFRDLVKDLASIFKTRIELRQIGVRDEARMLGGLGVCGKPFCCAQFLDDFQPVSIKMAKTQGLSLNPTKISGTCGRLMCCLKYEQDAYEDLVKNAPKVDSFVETPMGKGTVIDVNLLRGTARVRLENPLETTLKVFAIDQLEVLGGKVKRAEYLAAVAEGKIVPVQPEHKVKPDFPKIREPQTMREPQIKQEPLINQETQIRPVVKPEIGEMKKTEPQNRENRPKFIQENRHRHAHKPAQKQNINAEVGKNPEQKPKSDSNPPKTTAPLNASDKSQSHKNRNRYYRRKPKKQAPGQSGAPSQNPKAE